MASSCDKIDLEILELLLEDGSLTKAEISKRIGLAPSAVFERIKKLKNEGILKGFEGRLNPAKLGFELLAFISIGEIKPNKGFNLGGALAKVTGVEEVHKIASEDCFLIKLRTRNTVTLAEILNNEINQIQNVANVRSTIVLQTVKEESPLKGYSLR